MMTAQSIADALGRKAIAEAVGVGETAVGNAIARKRFPTSWLLILSAMCRERGVECPPALFGMKLPDDATKPHNVDAPQSAFPDSGKQPKGLVA